MAVAGRVQQEQKGSLISNVKANRRLKKSEKKNKKCNKSSVTRKSFLTKRWTATRLVLAELYKNRKIAQATHNMYAYRIYNDRTRLVLQDCEDDGETHAGSRMMHLMQVSISGHRSVPDCITAPQGRARRKRLVSFVERAASFIAGAKRKRRRPVWCTSGDACRPNSGLLHCAWPSSPTAPSGPFERMYGTSSAAVMSFDISFGLERDFLLVFIWWNSTDMLVLASYFFSVGAQSKPFVTLRRFSTWRTCWWWSRDGSAASCSVVIDSSTSTMRRGTPSSWVASWMRWPATIRQPPRNETKSPSKTTVDLVGRRHRSWSAGRQTSNKRPSLHWVGLYLLLDQ